MSVDDAMQREAQKKEDIPLLPLVPIKRSIKKGDTITFKLRSDPTDDHSPTFEITMQPKIYDRYWNSKPISIRSSSA